MSSQTEPTIPTNDDQEPANEAPDCDAGMVCKCGSGPHPKSPRFTMNELARLGCVLVEPELRAALSKVAEGGDRSNTDALKSVEQAQTVYPWLQFAALFNDDKFKPKVF